MTNEKRDRIAQSAESKGMTASRAVALSYAAWNDFVVALDEPMPYAAAELLGREPIWA
ncbi:hypothetical protein [Bifidobacterium aerophilum]|nr:hypothetical protein [Bifidobacterium aerophilum]